MKKIIVVHSGGMDSSICLAKAVDEYGKDAVLALSFSYGQRHESAELERSKQICSKFGVERKEVLISSLDRLTNNALLEHDIPIQWRGKKPNTLVIGRNGLMARLAAIHAESLGINTISMGIIGVEAANSGYRDCTRDYMDKMQEIMRIDLDSSDFKIETPLVDMDKVQTMELASSLEVLEFLLETTISCYEGLDKEGCLKCPACLLRNQGIIDYNALHQNLNISYLDKLKAI